ncbi:MAG: hypothetical protein PUH03_03200 [bacterium]|nr:hypothetical protein [bacterium]MDY2829864.1 hypothetical protein [Alphaproteobacteria bacterium]
MKKIFIFLLLIFTISVLSACGKSARPVPYPDSGYPRTYPNNR